MRPLRLLLSLCCSLVAIILLLYIAFGSSRDDELRNGPAPPRQNGKLKALFSFTSPGSLFPPSAIISLTDDNSTFFLARPAAFGPALPSNGLSGPLWIGTGFGDDAMGRGELGCSDVPGWTDGDHGVGLLGLKTASDATTSGPGSLGELGAPHTEQLHARAAESTDNYLNQHMPASRLPKAHSSKTSGHADIQTLQEAAEIAGKVVLLKRGGCGFLEKVLWAQRRGGVALIVGDDVRGGGLVRMYAHGDTSNVTIPSLFTSYTTAHLLSSLIPTAGLIHDLSPEDAAKLNLIKSGKGGKNNNHDKPGKPGRPTGVQDTENLTQSSHPGIGAHSGGSQKHGWLRSFLSFFGFGRSARTSPRADSRRPPSSGELDWVLADHPGDDQVPVGTKPATAKSTSTPTPSDFVIGEQDWRGPALLPESKSVQIPSQSLIPDSKRKTNLPSSGEYARDGTIEAGRWAKRLLGAKPDRASKADLGFSEGKSTSSPPDAHARFNDPTPHKPKPHEGLWVTLTPTNMSTSPFFDTLLVLVVSPLVTLTVVYALLLLRSRIRRRRWRAPKSLVERLPVRTYHTISDISPAPTPTASSPSTPLLQHTPPRPNSSLARPQSRAELEPPATSSSIHQPHRTPEEEKRETGLAAWRRRYGGRQKECVVCLEEYVDGISRVMSLPCGHEFHADCM